MRNARQAYIGQRRLPRLVMVLATFALVPQASLMATEVQQAQPAATERLSDGIAAIVDKDVITLRELSRRVAEVHADLARRGIQLPPDADLEQQVLQRMITERLEQHEAERLHIAVNDAQVDQAIAVIAQRNGMSQQELQHKIEESGLTWAAYRTEITDSIRLDAIRQRAVDPTITISNAEIDAFLAEQESRANAVGTARPNLAAPVSVHLAQILVRVPEGAASSDVAALRQRAEGVLARARAGEDFASLAAAVSDGPEAFQGGDMGERPLQAWPDLFISAIRGLQPGQVTELVQSGNGFHIIKVVSSAGGNPAQAQQQLQFERSQQALAEGPMPVTQTHARHILIKTSAVMSDEQARTRLEQLRQRILEGKEKFEDLARQHSNDTSAPQGGDLGWLTPGETVPPFEQAMDALDAGQVSQPVQSPFGWHLIKVEERRTQDMAEEYQRMQARQILFERRAGPAFEEWLGQLRDQAYIENRLEKRARLEQEL